jgi:hypothetical protein
MQNCLFLQASAELKCILPWVVFPTPKQFLDWRFPENLNYYLVEDAVDPALLSSSGGSLQDLNRNSNISVCMLHCRHAGLRDPPEGGWEAVGGGG